MQNTNNHAVLRKQIADCLRYIRRTDGWNNTRDKIYDVIGKEFGTCDLSYLVETYGPTAVVHAESYFDYDDVETSYVVMSRERKQTDEEYFDSVCSIISPTPYQLEEYQQYLRLKLKYS